MTCGQAVLGFGVVAALLTIVPGVDTSLVLRSAFTRSRGYAWATALGILTGTIVWGVAAAAGATAILAASEVAYRIVGLAGAVYLVGLGVWFVLRSFKRVPDEQALPTPSGGIGHGWAMGLMTNLLNPKVGVFYLATIPQFLPGGVSPLVMGVVLAGVHNLLGLVWFGAIIGAGTALAPRLRSAAFVRWLDRVTGGVLLFFGARLLWDARN